MPSSSSQEDAGSAFGKSLQTERVVDIHDVSRGNADPLVLRINRKLQSARKMIMLTGAGISCNAGIPDFRSQDNGLYDTIKRQFPELSIRTGKEMFDISLFRDETKISVFAAFMERLYSNCRLASPTKTHKFIAHLKNRNKLLRCYTQNIDGLEEYLGLEVSSKQDHSLGTRVGSEINSIWRNYDVVQLHGDLNTLSCTRCFHNFAWNRYWARSFRRGELPLCPECEKTNNKRFQQGKRQLSGVGYLRPNIVLYGENHPSGDIISQGINLDLNRGKPDFLIIMGTSLKVDGVKRVVKQVSKQVHERGGLVILVNKTKIADSNWHGVIDYQICMDCDDWVMSLEDTVPDLFKTQEQIDKLRKMKREASDIRKKEKLKKMVKTPPSTPLKHENSDTNIQFSGNNIANVKRKLLDLTPPSSQEMTATPKKLKRESPL